MAFFDLIIQTSAGLHPACEPDEYIVEYDAVIRYQRDRDGKVFRVGKMHAYRIQAELAADAGELLFEVCDAHSQQLHDFHRTVYDPDGYSFREDLALRFDIVNFDCLLLDYVILHPKWRGLRIGLMATRKLVDMLGGGCGMVVSDILPLRHAAHERVGVPASWIPKHDTNQKRRVARKKLRWHFRRLGFERIGRTAYYGLSTAKRTPSAEDVLKPSEGT